MYLWGTHVICTCVCTMVAYIDQKTLVAFSNTPRRPIKIDMYAMLKLNRSRAQKKLMRNPYFLFLRYWMRTCFLSWLNLQSVFVFTFLISFSRDRVTAAALKQGYRNKKQ